MTPELRAAKRATREMIKGVGGLEAAAPYCRVGKSVLGEAQSDTTPHRYVPVDVVAALEPLAREREGWPHVTAWLCGQMGGVFVMVPEGAASDSDVLRGFGKMSREFGDTSEAILGALADGRFSDPEIDRADAELTQFIEAAVATREAVRALRGAGR